MRFLLYLIIIASEYYSFSYGLYIWKNENKKLAGFGVLLITLIGIIIPIVFLYFRM